MRKEIFRLVLALLLFSGCNETEIVQLNLKGKILGEVYTIDKISDMSKDNENINIRLEGSDPLIFTTTDSTGQYELNDVPTGTYNVIFSKEGYCDFQRQGFQVVGGDNPLYLDAAVAKISDTTIKNLSLNIVNGAIYMKGIVNHTFTIDEMNLRSPRIRYFIHKEDNPSDMNYLKTGTINFHGESGGQLESQISIYRNLFSSGSKIYIIAYGCSIMNINYYDISLDQYIYPSLSTGSNIASITIP